MRRHRKTLTYLLTFGYNTENVTLRVFFAHAHCKDVERGNVTVSLSLVFTTRCYASAVLAMGLCPSVSVSLSVCLSETSRCSTKTAKRSCCKHKQHHTILRGHYFSDAKDLREIRPKTPTTGAPNAGGVGQNRRLSTNNRLYLENGKR